MINPCGLLGQNIGGGVGFKGLMVMEVVLVKMKLLVTEVVLIVVLVTEIVSSIHPFILFVHLSIHQFIHSSIHSFICPSVRPLIHSLIRSFIHSFRDDHNMFDTVGHCNRSSGLISTVHIRTETSLVSVTSPTRAAGPYSHPFIHSFIRPFIHSAVYLFIHS